MPDASNPPVDEALLVRRARRGDHAAFAALYQRHARAVHALAWRLSGDATLAEDLVQEAFLRMLRFIGGIRPELPVRPWLKRVVGNLAIDHLRRVWREQALPEDGELVLTADPGIDDIEQSSKVAELLRRLPPLARTLVWLHLVEGWSHGELAARFRRSESWSKSIVSRALALLRRQAESRSTDHE